MMKKNRWLHLTVLSGGAYLLWRYEQEKIESVPPLTPEEAQALVERALPLLRLPTAPDEPAELAFSTEGDGKFIGLRCPRTHRIYPFQGRVLNLVEHEPQLTPTQRSLSTPFTSWAYDRLRDAAMSVVVPPFAQEADDIAGRLRLAPGDQVLDLCCGPGNFTLEWARRVGPSGLVIGLDLSRAMLARAAYHVHRAGLSNVLLIRGDAQRLPLAAGSLSRINCSGGLHQLPDLPQALRELCRVSRPGTTLTLSTFAAVGAEEPLGTRGWLREHADLHFVPLGWLGEQLTALGFAGYEARMAGPLFGYASAHRP